MASSEKLPPPNEDNRIPEKRAEIEIGFSQPLSAPDSGAAGLHEPLSKGVKRLEIRLTEELYEAIKAIADEEGRSFSEVFRRAFSLYATAHKKSKEEILLGFVSVNERNELIVENIIRL
jgi:hypothetical protein